MGVTVFHSLTATTPDNTQYEIKPSNWNSNHAVSLSLAGSDVSNAFTNSPSVTFGTDANGYISGLVNTSYIPLGNSSSIMPIASSSNFLGSAASGSFINTSLSSSIMPIASSSNFLGSGATGSFVNTSVSSRFAGTGFSSTTTAGTAITAALGTNGLTMAIPAFITAAAGVQTGISGVAVSNTTYTSGTFSFRDGNNISFASGTGQGVSITHNLQSAGAYLTTAMQSQSSSVFAKTGFTSTTTAGTAIVATHDTNGLSMGIPAFITAAAGAQTAISGMVVSNTTYTSGTVSFRDGNNISFASGTGQGISITHNLQSAGAYLTTAMQSQSSSVFAKTGFTSATTAGTAIVATHDTNGLSMGIPAYITTYASQTNQTANLYATGANTTQLSSTAGIDLRSISISGAGAASAGVSGGIILVSAPPTSVLSGLGNITVGTTGSTIGISGGGGGGGNFSAGISTGGNTSGTTGTVSNQIVFVGGNNVTLSGSTGAGGATVTISGANLGGAQTGISGVAVSNTTYTSGTFSFRDGNNISFASGTGQGVSITHNLQSAGNYLTTAAQSNQVVNSLNGSTGQISLNVGSSLSASTNGSSITFGLASNITTALQSAGAYLTTAMQSQSSSVFAKTGFTSTTTAGTAIVATHDTNGLSMGIPAFITAAAGAQTAISGMAVSNTTYTSGTVSFRDGNNISFASGTGQGISITHNLQSAGNYLTTAAQSNQVVNSLNGSTGQISLNVGSSLSASSAGSAITFGLASNITTALQSAGAYLTTAAQSSASNVSLAVAATNNTGGGTASLSGAVSFSNANGLTFYTSAGNAIVASYSVPTVPTAYVSSVNGSSGAISLNVGSSLSASTNGSSVTFGLASNITTALQSAGAYLTTAMQSQSSSVFAKTGFTSTTTAGTAIVATHDTNGLSMGIPAYITTYAAQTAQTANLYATGANTTQLSSTAGVDLRSISISGAGAASAGVSGGIILVSAPPTSVLSGLGNITVGTTGSTIGISGGGGGGGSFSAGISTGGNTAGTTGTVSNQIVFVGGNNVTLSGSTAAGGATVTISGANIGGAQTGISGMVVSNTTYTSGTVSFRDGNNISFASGTGQGISITHNLQSAGAYLTTAAQSNQVVNSLNGSTGQISLNVGSSLSASSAGSAITFGLASNITTALQSAGAYLTTAAQSSASNVSQIIAATNSTGGGTSTLTGGVTFGNSNGLTHYITNGSLVASYSVPTVPTAYVSSVNGSSGAISLNVGSSLSASTNGSSITFGLASNITTALQSAGAYLTTAAQSSASNVSLAVAATNNTGGGTASLSGAVSFSNANGLTFYTSAGNAIVASYSVPTVPTAYVSSVNGSSGAISLNVGSSLSASTNGSSITFGLASNITTALQSAGAYLTTAAQSSASNVSLAVAATNNTGGGTASLSGAVSFSNANGLTFYTSAGNAIVASYSVPTVPTAYVSSVNGSSGAISLNVGSSLSASTNGSSVTFGLASNITTALQSAGAYLTTAMQSQSSSVFAKTGFTSTTTAGTAIVATHDTNGLSMGIPAFITAAGGVQTAISGMALSNTTYTSGTVSFRDGNNISFASGTGQGISITHNLQSAGAYLTTAMQSQSSSVFAKTGFTSATTAGTAIVATHDTNGLSMGIPAYITTAPSTAGLISAINVSAGTTSNNLSAITFANTGNVTFGMAGSVITASAPSGGGGGVAIAASNTTFTSGTVVMSAAGGALTISSGAQSVLMSVPATSSIIAVSGVALSSTSNSIYIYNDFHDFFSAGVVGASATYTNSNNSVLAFLPLYPVDNYSFTAFEQLAYWLWTSVGNASYAASQTLRYGLYKMDTANGSQMTLVNSSSMFMHISANSNVSGAYTVNFNNSATSFSSSSAGTGVLSAIAGKTMVLRLPFAGSFQAGEVYALGMHYSYTQTNATTNSRPFYQWGNTPNVFTSGQGLGFIGPSTVDGGATTAQLENQGWIYSASTGAFPNTISTQESRANASGFAPQVIFKNIQ